MSDLQQHYHQTGGDPNGEAFRQAAAEYYATGLAAHPGHQHHHAQPYTLMSRPETTKAPLHYPLDTRHSDMWSSQMSHHQQHQAAGYHATGNAHAGGPPCCPPALFAQQQQQSQHPSTHHSSHRHQQHHEQQQQSHGVYSLEPPPLEPVLDSNIPKYRSSNGHLPYQNSAFPSMAHSNSSSSPSSASPPLSATYLRTTNGCPNFYSSLSSSGIDSLIFANLLFLLTFCVGNYAVYSNTY